jgi:transcriptional regulator with XRE-family HTH domain
MTSKAKKPAVTTEKKTPVARKNAASKKSPVGKKAAKTKEKAPEGAYVSKGDKALIAVFTDRLTQIIDRRQDVIRSGRGRTNDFAVKFGMHYTTANRLLKGESLPPADVLCQIAEAFDVTESWLLGRNSYDVDELLDNGSTRIHIFNPRSESSDKFLTIPTTELPMGFDSSKLVFNKTTTELGEDVSVIVKLTAEVQEGRVHLLYDPKNAKTYLRRINIVPSQGALFCFGTDTGLSETLKIENVEFGNLSKRDDQSIDESKSYKVVILGPVVARIAFGFKGD